MNTGLLKLIRIAVGSVLIVIALLGLRIYLHHGKIRVTILTAPRQASISIDDKQSGHKIWLQPGQHKVKVSYPDFAEYVSNFRVQAGILNELSVALAPQSESAKKIAKAETSAYLQVESRGDREARQAGQSFVSNYPVVSNLPYRSDFYAIDYGKDSSGGFQIEITAAEPVGRQVALSNIRRWGFDPTDYKIVFKGFRNVFE